MVECACLENKYVCKGIAGSNPVPSAIFCVNYISTTVIKPSGSMLILTVDKQILLTFNSAPTILIARIGLFEHAYDQVRAA